MSAAKNVYLNRFLENPTAGNLASAFSWMITPQGYEYWNRIYDILLEGGPVPKEAMKYIYEKVGEPFPGILEEAEWE